MKTKITNLKNKIAQNKIFKAIILTILIWLNIALYLTPNTLINSGFFVVGLFIFLGYGLIYALYRLIKKKKIIFSKTKKELFNLIINSLLIGVFINCLFFLLLQLVNPQLSYDYSFGNYQAYNNATTPIYLLITIIILPLFNNLLLRRLINKFRTKKGKIIFSILLSFLIFCTSATYISGIYFMIISLGLNLFYIKNNSLKETFIIESLISLVLGSMTLWLSTYKIIIVIIMIVICLSSFLINFNKE